MAAEQSTERWLPIPGFEGHYSVSDRGAVVNARGKTLSPRDTGTGHLQLALYKDNQRHNLQVHRLVLAAFVGPCPDGMEVRHLNGDPTDNRLTNLKYGTSAENKQDMLRHGTHHLASKTHCKNGHAFTPGNTYSRATPSGGTRRNCRSCARERAKRYKERKRLAVRS